MENDWISVKDALPKEGEVVKTKIDNEQGCRNIGYLKRMGNLWFVSDGSIYVYYTPTHWQHQSKNDLP